MSSDVRRPPQTKQPIGNEPQAKSSTAEDTALSDAALSDTVAIVTGDTVLAVPVRPKPAAPTPAAAVSAAFIGPATPTSAPVDDLPRDDVPPKQEVWFADLQARVDNLPEEFKELGEGLRRLIGQIVVLDSEMALTRARKVLELVMSDVYQRCFKEPAGRRSLDELINALAKAKQLPREVQGDAYSVRVHGNAGAHQGHQVTSDEVGAAVKKLLPVVDWYVEARRSGQLDRDTGRPPPSQPTQPMAAGVVPKGLRSFDARDSKFFLELVPGPRYDKGLPEQLQRWKDRVEVEGEIPFTVGVVYGPSGCGKSSLMKAGLLPNLKPDRVRSVYLEASADSTEQRLLAALRKRFPTLPPELDLTLAIQSLRVGKGFVKKQKVLIVLDQFEQWLHAHRGEDNTELARALRQCDGDRVQVVLMVREDFLGQVNRFLDQLNVALKQGENLARVDLFDIPHARKVLTAFGLGYGRLQGEPTAEQQAFIEQAVDGLAEDRCVICVRLALFAEMVKDKPWTPRTLEQVGGAEGVGATFLEETFSAPSADATCRQHQQAARAVLKALLPEEGSDIRGQAKPVSQLLTASGYEKRPREFAELMRILDSELRLITPAASSLEEADDRDGESDSAAAAEDASPETDSRCFQLTHDFLVPALREWLDRKQRETRSGRAGLLIASRAAMWKIKRENRFLPSPREFIVIHTLTDRRAWSPLQQEMMQRALRVHLRRGVVLVGLLAALGIMAMFIVGRINDARDAQQAKSLVEEVRTDDLAKFGDTLNSLKPYKAKAEPLLLDARLRAGSDEERQKFGLALALLGSDTSVNQMKTLNDWLLAVDSKSFKTLCNLLKPFGSQLADWDWQVLENDKADTGKRFEAAAALAAYIPESDADGIYRWSIAAPFVADNLVTKVAENEVEWVEAFQPRQIELLDPLSKIYRDPNRSSVRLPVTTVLATYARAVPSVLIGLLADASGDRNCFAVLYKSLHDSGQPSPQILAQQLSPKLGAGAKDAELDLNASHVANAAVALLRLQQADSVWPLFGRPVDPGTPLGRMYPRVRSFLIHRVVAYSEGDSLVATLLVQRFNQESDPTAQQGLLLTLGTFPESQLSASARQPIMDKLSLLYRTAPDAGTRGAAEWLLRAWGQEAQLAAADHELAGGQPSKGQAWFVNGQGQTMVADPSSRSKITVGSPPTEQNREPGKVEDQHPATIGYSYAIAAHEVTLGEFLAYSPSYQPNAKYLTQGPDGSPDKRCPVNNVTWYQAAAYCNWLSQQEHLEACYQPNKDQQFAAGMKPYDDFLARSGYRLPTEAEWEWACRAGTGTSRYYGQADELLPDYAWFADDSKALLQPVGRLKPNDWGLFDMLGNALEWTQDYCLSNDANFVGHSDAAAAQDGQIRIARSEKFLSFMANMRVARRDYKHGPEKQDFIMGFRPVRTLVTATGPN